MVVLRVVFVVACGGQLYTTAKNIIEYSPTQINVVSEDNVIVSPHWLAN